ncbi:MAG: PIN domain-containing protein [Terriglobia bacterium]
MTIAAIADTHAVIWSLFGDSRLSAAARAFIAHAAQSGASVGVSGMTMVEIVYLVEKGRIPRDTLERLLRLLSDPDDVLAEIPVDHAIAEAMRQVDRQQVPDLPDRVIAATAVHYQVPLISRDRKIQSAGFETIW